MHLLTREALALYLAQAARRAACSRSTSPTATWTCETVLGNLARDAGLTCFAGNLDAPLADGIEEANASAWVALARTREDLGEVATRGLWRTCPIGPRSHTWTDDYSNILSVLALVAARGLLGVAQRAPDLAAARCRRTRRGRRWSDRDRRLGLAEPDRAPRPPRTARSRTG